MQGAASAGGFVERAEAAQSAGCDMLLLCNNREGCIDVLDHANISVSLTSGQRLSKLLKTAANTNAWSTLKQDLAWKKASDTLNHYR